MVEKEKYREALEEWAATGRSLTSVLRKYSIDRRRFWFLVKTGDLGSAYRGLTGLWSFNAMDQLLAEAEQRLEESGHAAWGAVLQKQVQAMVAVISPRLEALEADEVVELPDAMQRVEEILALGRERLAAADCAENPADCADRADCADFSSNTPRDDSSES